MKDKKIIKKPNRNKKEKYAQEFYKQIVESRKAKKMREDELPLKELCEWLDTIFDKKEFDKSLKKR